MFGWIQASHLRSELLFGIVGVDSDDDSTLLELSSELDRNLGPLESRLRS